MNEDYLLSEFCFNNKLFICNLKTISLKDKSQSLIIKPASGNNSLFVTCYNIASRTQRLIVQYIFIEVQYNQHYYIAMFQFMCLEV